MRVTRLSGAAIELLTHLAAEDARIEFHQREGVFQLLNGTAPIRIPSRTVQVLASARLILKDPQSNGRGAQYVLSERGRNILSGLARMLVDE